MCKYMTDVQTVQKKIWAFFHIPHRGMFYGQLHWHMQSSIIYPSMTKGDMGDLYLR